MQVNNKSNQSINQSIDFSSVSDLINDYSSCDLSVGFVCLFSMVYAVVVMSFDCFLHRDVNFHMFHYLFLFSPLGRARAMAILGVILGYVRVFGFSSRIVSLLFIGFINVFCFLRAVANQRKSSQLSAN